MIKTVLFINHNIFLLQSVDIFICNLFFVLHLQMTKPKFYLLLENLAQLSNPNLALVFLLIFFIDIVLLKHDLSCSSTFV